MHITTRSDFLVSIFTIVMSIGLFIGCDSKCCGPNPAPAETASEEAVPGETASEEAAPAETTSEEVAPAETAPAEAVPGETASEETDLSEGLDTGHDAESEVPVINDPDSATAPAGTAAPEHNVPDDPDFSPSASESTPKLKDNVDELSDIENSVE